MDRDTIRNMQNMHKTEFANSVVSNNTPTVPSFAAIQFLYIFVLAYQLCKICTYSYIYTK